MPIRRITGSPHGARATPADPVGEAVVSPPARTRRGADVTPARPEPSLNEDREIPEGRNYEVGRGKPPVHTRFRKGQSGNPNGRPKGARGLKRLVRENLLARVPVRMAGSTRRITRIEAMIHKQLEQAMKGDQRAAIQLMNLYAAAVPDEAEPEGGSKADPLSAGEQQILDYLLGSETMKEMSDET